MRIFTHSIISPGLSLRQCPSRCTFRAGRNLPDKEFRYLRTVIVTAAVYWGFSSALCTKCERFPLTFQHRAGVSPYTSPFGFAETCVRSEERRVGKVGDLGGSRSIKREKSRCNIGRS